MSVAAVDDELVDVTVVDFGAVDAVPDELLEPSVSPVSASMMDCSVLVTLLLSSLSELVVAARAAGRQVADQTVHPLAPLTPAASEVLLAPLVLSEEATMLESCAMNARSASETVFCPLRSMAAALLDDVWLLPDEELDDEPVVFCALA